MRTVIFGIMTGFTWYLAAMYRMEALMTLAVMEALILLSMPMCVWYVKRNLEVTFLQRFMAVNRSEYTECPFWIRNRGILPVSRIRIRFSYAYEGESDRKHVIFSGNADRKRSDKEKITLPVPWNGKLLVYMEKIEIYDYFSLFRARIRRKEDMVILILPPEGKMQTGADLSNGAERSMSDEMLMRGKERKESVQVREYVQGDPYRHIHWKLSARTETLLVREYQEERQKSVFVCLDFHGYGMKEQREISAFFDILWALVSGMAEEGDTVWLEWKNRTNMVMSEAVHDKNTLAEVFGRLYERDWSEEEYGADVYDGESKIVFRFGVDLKFASCEEELFHFTLEHYELELKSLY